MQTAAENFPPPKNARRKARLHRKSQDRLRTDSNDVLSACGRAGGGRFLIDAITEGVVFEFDGVIARPFGLPQLIVPVEGVGKPGRARISLPQIGKSAMRICQKAVDACGVNG